MEIDVAQLLAARAQAHQRSQDGTSLKDWVQDRLTKAEAEVDRLKRFKAHMELIGDEPIARLSKFINGEDPDAPPPSQMKIGPHGEGCECPPGVDIEDDPGCDPTTKPH